MTYLRAAWWLVCATLNMIIILAGTYTVAMFVVNQLADLLGMP